MALNLQQTLKLQQQMVMTPQLQMAIKLLQLSRLELVQAIRKELEANPTLEEVDETQQAEVLENNEADGLSPAEDVKEVKIEENFDDRIDWQAYMEEFNAPGRIRFESEERERPDYEAFTPSRPGLADHLRWQLAMTDPDEKTKTIGELIIGNIDRHGYLDAELDEIAELAGCSRPEVLNVLKILQEFDPPGICARDLSECLLIQLKQLDADHPLLEKIIKNHLKDLENKRYNAIANELGIDIDTVKSAVEIIRGLNPRPGDLFSEDEHIYITPDVYVYKDGDDFAIVLNDEGIPFIRINSYYENKIREGRLSREDKVYIQDRIRSAKWLIKSIEQRKKTIYNVVKSIIYFQREFFEKGVDYLKPLVLREVAQDIGMHESTISRVTTNKYVHTPHGIFELKFFFNSSLRQSNGKSVSSMSVKQLIKKMVDEEDPKKPLTDKEIVQQLKKNGIEIARRTVAKYREQMGILPSVKRRQP